MEHSSKARGGKGSASGEHEGERMFIWCAAMETHFGIERDALMGLAMRRVGLNELVVKKHSWFGNKIEQFVGI